MNGFDIFPAIDLYDGKVIRLTEGNFEKIKEYGNDPIATALSFAEVGARWIHLIDLEGALKGRPIHLRELETIAKATGLPIQYGGGLRKMEDVSGALSYGAERVYLGSLIFKGNPETIWAKFGPSVVPSVDVKDRTVAISGWTEVTKLTPKDALRNLVDTGYRTFLVTSISRDGTGSGPDLSLYESMKGLGGNILAAGGIGNIRDIVALRRIGISGAILGKSLYEGTIDLGEALEEARRC